jgi:predicted Zn-dependent protease
LAHQRQRGRSLWGPRLGANSASGDLAGARTEIDTLLASQPENIDALAFQGELQEAANDKDAALKSFEKALLMFAKRNPNPPEPPVYLLRKRLQLSRALGMKY